MPKNRGRVETNYVVNITTELENAYEESFPLEESGFELIDKSAFVSLCQQHYDFEENEAELFWNQLLGFHPSGNKGGCGIEYLTLDSFHVIMAHYPLFISGIDFHHLPLGFFLTKNNAGVRNVLHYNDFLAKNGSDKSPLALILSPKVKSPLQDHEFQFPQSQWYEFLRSKMTSKSHTFCTEAELKKAFMHFSNELNKLHLSFYEPDFSNLNEDFNPIIVLGRWTTILTQPHLKKTDVSEQWQQMLQLGLTRGYNALLAITDYQYTNCPCGFLVPEMFEAHQYLYSDINSVNSFNDIQHIGHFWRYLAYQPQRNSIEFYRRALAVIEDTGFTAQQKLNMQQILAGSTTKENHSSLTIADEEFEAYRWETLCNQIITFKTQSYHLRFAASLIGASKFDDETISFLKKTYLPNMAFLHSFLESYIACGIAVNLATINIGSMTKKFLPAKDKFYGLINIYPRAVYNGCRFYLKNDGVWTSLGILEYINLIDEINSLDIAPEVREALISCCSTFAIKNCEDANCINQALTHLPNEHQPAINFALGLFQDVIEPQSVNIIVKFIEDFQVKFEGQYPPSFLLVLEYVEEYFKESNSFSENYFTQKKQQLRDLEEGLNPDLDKRVHNLRFSNIQEKVIIALEQGLFRKNNRITAEQFEQLNNQFLHLSRLLTPADFTELLIRLQSMGMSLPADPAMVIRLLTLLAQRRTLEGFNQIYFRNKIEKCFDDFLIEKFLIFIETLKPMGKAIGPISAIVVQDLLATLLLNSTKNSIEQKDFLVQITFALQAIKRMVREHPHVQHYLLEAFNHIEPKNTEDYWSNVQNLINCMNEVRSLFSVRDVADPQENMLTIFALFAKFYQEPLKLVQLWQQIKGLKNPKQQTFILLLANNLIENGQSIEGLETLINIINTHPERFTLLKEHCSTPPYANIMHLNKWLDGENFAQEYEAYSLKPYGERYSEFAFKREEFETQRAKFAGVGPEVLTSEFADNFERQTKVNRSLSIQALRQKFAELKDTNVPLSMVQKQNLLSVCIEMLARTTAQWDHGTPPKRISQELNTTQVLALYSMLTHPNPKLISEIATGEGKSRINMILAACQVAQGKTVDFITSDMPLAVRDYLSYRAFFKSLDIETSVITLETPKALYKKGGVNFSDTSQLLLQRNKSDIDGESFAYLDEIEENRCLLIDEVDKFTHDKNQDVYNFAAQSKTLKGYIWIYPLLVRFMRQHLLANGSLPFNPESLKDPFVTFVTTNDIDELHQASVAQLKEKDPAQLVTWLKAAHTAWHMIEDQDYKVTDNSEVKLFLVRDTEGHIRYTRKVKVIDDGRIAEASTFSLGVQQCLCAIENYAARDEQFVIPPENKTQRSSYPVSFMRQYAKGSIYGASGTTRSEAPVARAAINYENYAFITVPRHKISRRVDKNVWPAKDAVQQIDFIKRILKEKLSERPQRPVLLISKNDERSNLLHQALLRDADLVRLIQKCTRVHGLTEKEDEVNAINEAGTPGFITISTVGMFGRGVDINAKNLVVLYDYVPSFEDEIQIKGRTGRGDKEGETRMVPNISDLDCPLNGATYNIHREIDEAQKRMALSAINEEEVSKLYADFLENVHQQFLSDYRTKGERDKLALLENWQNYLNNLQKDWDYHKPELLAAIEEQDRFISLFNEFTQKWEAQAHFIAKAEKASFTEERVVTAFKAIEEYRGFFKEQKPKSLTVQNQYDLADDGQARIYSSLFAQTTAMGKGARPFFANYKAWKEGRGILFPDLLATLKGDRPLFANLRATIARLIAALKKWWNQEESTPLNPPPQKELSLYDSNMNVDADEDIDADWDAYKYLSRQPVKDADKELAKDDDRELLFHLTLQGSRI